MKKGKHRKITIGTLCLLFTWLSIGCGKESEEPAPPLTGYIDKVIQGFTIKVAAKNENFQITQQALAKITSDLGTIVPFYTSEQLAALRAHPIWLEMNTDPAGAARYHPIGAEPWLIEHGLSTDKVQCVEISNMVNYINWSGKNQPFMLLHELSHLYHNQKLINGFDNQEVLNAYNAAKNNGKYYSVRYYTGIDTLSNQRAYAMDNQMEYFAELSEAYFGNNDYQPFTNNELRTFDPVGFNVLVSVWGARP